LTETLLYVGDGLIDLLPGTQIFISIQKIDIGKLQPRLASFTNSFEVPPTENNLIKLGFPTIQNSNSTKPYSLLDCKLVQGGVEVIPNAKLFINRIKKTIKVTVFESIIDLYQNIKGKSLYDINPIASSGWTASDIDTARTNTEGIITVVLNWGKPGAIYQENYFLPCFYYHSIIKSALQFTGLTLSGSILTDPRFTDLVMPFNGEFLYPQTYINDANGKALPSANYSIPDLLSSDGDLRIDLNTVEYGADNFDLPNNEYEAPGWFNLTVEAVIDVSAITWNDGTSLIGKLKIGAATVDSGTIVLTPTTSGSLTLDYTSDVVIGDQIYFTISTDAPVIGVAVTIEATSYLKVICNPAVNRVSVNWNELLQNISCEDLIKDFFIRFSILPKQVGNIIYLKSLEAICTDRDGAIDWSEK